MKLVKDLSAIVMEQFELRRLALYDSLTTVRSRRGFRSEAEFQLALALLEDRQFSLLVFDIDHFKQFNDQYGHKGGDEVLVAITDRASRLIDDRHMLGRIGGDEFAIALDDIDLHEAHSLAEEIRSVVNGAPIETSAGPVSVSISVGAASAQQDCDFDDLLERADLALYQAKAQGRNCVSVCGRKTA